MDNQSYYDAFSGWYERGRDRGYHAFLDRDRRTSYQNTSRQKWRLCGTGLILKNIALSLVQQSVSTLVMVRCDMRGTEV